MALESAPFPLRKDIEAIKKILKDIHPLVFLDLVERKRAFSLKALVHSLSLMGIY
jgi:hypothetical protein